MANGVMSLQAAEVRLNQMLTDYHDSLPWSYRVPVFGSDPLRAAIGASPDLKAKLVDAISDGYLTSFRNTQVEAGAAAEYGVATRAMTVPESALGNKNELIFLLGHENQHARHMQGADYRRGTLLPALQAVSQGAGPYDYTTPIQNFMERTRTEEGQAHIGGFNAVVSALSAAGKGTTPEDIYKFNPGRMRDFIDVGGAFPQNTYTMKAGLTQQPDGSLDWSAQNVNAMKQYYADKTPGSFGDNGLLNYRHQAVLDGWQIAHMLEKIQLDGTNTQRAYTVDFTQLGINPAMLNVPNNGPGGVGQVTVSDPRTIADQRPLAEFPQNVVVDRQTGLGMLGLLPPAPAPAPQVPAPAPAQTGTSIGDSFNAFWNRLTGSPIEQLDQGARTPPRQDSPLFQQAGEGLSKLGKDSGAQNREEFLNAAAALAAAAEKNGLTSIDHVLKGANGNVFAVQGDVASPLAQRAHIEIAQAVQQPSQQTLSQLQPPTAQPTPAPEAQSTQQKPHLV